MSLEKFSLEGNLAVITGGAGLLGGKHAEALLAANARVVLLDINEEALIKQHGILSDKYADKILSLPTDITIEDELIKSLELIKKKFSKYPDILINNAAIDAKFEEKADQSFSRLENFSVTQWQNEINVGLTGAMLCSKVFGFEMSKNGGGVILNITSDLGIISPDQRIYAEDGLDEKAQPVKPVTYSVIKHALIGLTKYLATYWADKNVRCNALAPGGIYTNQNQDFLSKIQPLIPLGRMANPDEYMAAVVFLCSDASSYMTGNTLVMDGGRSIW